VSRECRGLWQPFRAFGRNAGETRDFASIEPLRVEIRVKDVERRVPAEKIYILIGGELPAELLQRIGVEVGVKFGTA